MAIAPAATVTAYIPDLGHPPPILSRMVDHALAYQLIHLKDQSGHSPGRQCEEEKDQDPEEGSSLGVGYVFKRPRKSRIVFKPGWTTQVRPGSFKNVRDRGKRMTYQAARPTPPNENSHKNAMVIQVGIWGLFIMIGI